LSVTRISRAAARCAGLALVAALALAPLAAGAQTKAEAQTKGQAAAKSSKFRSPEVAFDQGLGAYKLGHTEMAILGFEEAAAAGLFPSEFYLARIYSDNAGSRTDHAKAYRYYQRIADQYADIDPDDDRRSPYVAKALTALAGYVLRGLPEIGLKANPARAAEILHHAAMFFNEEDAQFELAKLYLKGEGVPEDPVRAKHWLSVLTQKGHAGAQAFLADLLWRGKLMAKDQTRALALITLAVENAPAHERVWIEDIHQNIFCGASDGTRSQAGGIVADWRRRYGRAAPNVDRYGLAELQPRLQRTCSNGEPVNAPVRGGDPRGQIEAGRPGVRPQGAEPPAVMQGGAGGVGLLRDAGAKAPDSPPR
jgi:hypothetical protein